MSDERTLTSILEEYRYGFLEYLKSAEKVCVLRREVEAVQKMSVLFESGLKFTDEERTISAEAGFLLYRKYGMEFSKKGFIEAEEKILADFNTAKKIESFYWAFLSDLSEQAWGDRMESFRLLFISSPNAEQRILFYRHELEVEAMSPEALETNFVEVGEGLLQIVPISIDDD